MSTLSIENPTYAFLGAFVDELARNGLQNVVVCPGSRSTPLAYAFSAEPRIKLWMHYDERSAAFFALGMAKASNRAVALVCTSGTAAANFFPAVIEATLSRVPLLVLTADRPAELRDNGAPQTIDQLKMFGGYPRWFFEMPLPEATNDLLRFVRTIAGRAVGTAQGTPMGVVHLNMQFREPLTPAAIADQPLPPANQRNEVAWHGRAGGKPYVTLQQAPRRLPGEEMADLAEIVRTRPRGIIICGTQNDPELAQAVTDLAAACQYPVLADPLSQLRNGSHSRQLVISNYDAFLRDARFTTGTDFEPEIIIRFGAMPTAKPLLLFLKRFSLAHQIVVDGGDGWQEPTSLAESMVHAEPAIFARDLALAVQTHPHTQPTQWLTNWLEVATTTRQAVDGAMLNLEELFEGKILASLSHLLPNQSKLFIGNSMPIRDVDSFYEGSGKHIELLCNRGANGIDGTISTALGVAAVSIEPVVLALGDLTLYHDLNGLLAAKLHGLNLTVVLLNNDGGGIFSFLPQANYPENFEQLFGTPHGLDFRGVVEMYDGTFSRIANYPEFEVALPQAIQQGGLQVIEVPTNRARNVTLHRDMWAAVYKALGDLARSSAE